MTNAWLWIAILLLLIGCTDTPADKDEGISIARELRTPVKEGEDRPSSPSLSPQAAPAVGNPFVQLVDQPDGFKLKLTEENHDNPSAVQTVISPDPAMPVIHLIRRMAESQESKRYRMDILSVYPKQKAFKTVPFADVTVTDSYSVDSLVRAYGFSDSKHLVMVRPVEADGGMKYNIVSFNIQTGAITNLIEGALPDLAPDFLAADWMNRDGDKLFLNSFSGGKLWVADLKNRSVKVSDGSFRHQWPKLLLYRSPDGERFWYGRDRFQLYGSDGSLIASLPADGNLYSNPAFQWSPDSRFAAFEYTFDNRPENIIGGEDFVIIAPQGIRIYDREGQPVWHKEVKSQPNDARLEWSGWLGNGESGIIHSYELERKEGQPPRKIRPSYSLVDLSTGQTVELGLADRLEELKRPEAVSGKAGQILVVDAESNRYMIIGDDANDGVFAHLLSKGGGKQIVWAIFTNNETVVTRYDPATRTTAVTRWNEAHGYRVQLFGEDMVLDEDLTYRYIR